MFCFALLPAKPLPALPVDIWRIHRGSCLTDAKVDVVLQGALASLSLHKYLCTETDKRVRMRATHTNTHTHTPPPTGIDLQRSPFQGRQLQKKAAVAHPSCCTSQKPPVPSLDWLQFPETRPLSHHHPHEFLCRTARAAPSSSTTWLPTTPRMVGEGVEEGVVG